MAWLGLLMVFAGSILLVIAAWGVLILPDALSRQHAATKAGTLALASVCLGAALLVQDWQWSWRLLLIVVFLLLTLPVASHLLARNAIRTVGAEADLLTSDIPFAPAQTERRP